MEPGIPSRCNEAVMQVLTTCEYNVIPNLAVLREYITNNAIMHSTSIFWSRHVHIAFNPDIMALILWTLRLLMYREQKLIHYRSEFSLSMVYSLSYFVSSFWCFQYTCAKIRLPAHHHCTVECRDKYGIYIWFCNAWTNYTYFSFVSTEVTRGHCNTRYV